MIYVIPYFRNKLFTMLLILLKNEKKYFNKNLIIKN